MRDTVGQAKKALAVYLARGRAALAKLRAGQYDEATEVLRRRGAAFHNFRAVDALALTEGRDITADPAAQALWQEIRVVDVELRDELQEAHAKTAALYQKIRETRAKIAAYRSGRASGPRFEKTA
jgi:plasmid stability protein